MPDKEEIIMPDKEEIIKALNIIQKVCNSNISCQDCPLRINDDEYGDEFGDERNDDCYLSKKNPAEWEIKAVDVEYDWRAFED